MMQRSIIRRVEYRPYYNLPTKTPGRMMTGYMTPYRHWMWKQNELWRNVHEAQFEHLRKVYRRQWLESFRVNADEYIYKYNITKAAQLAQWEHEMHAQESKRREELETAQGRQQLKAKHLDLLREYHERHFFYWYERASERLQYMTKIQYVTADKLDDHIERELDKYVAGKAQGYPLNFVGQLPLLEGPDGSVQELHAELMANHAAENPGSPTPATSYSPPEVSADEQLRGMISGLDEMDLDVDGKALKEAVDDQAKDEDEANDSARVALSVEQTDDDRAIAKQKYINRGNVGSKNVYRKAKGDGTAPPAPSARAPLKPKRHLDEAHRKSQEFDAKIAQAYKKFQKEGTGAPNVRVGEVRGSVGRLMDRINVPSMEDVLSIPEMQSGNLGKQARTSQLTDKAFGRGKKGKDDDDNL